MVKRTRRNSDLLLVIKALDQGWQIDEKGQLLLDEETRGVYVRILTRAAGKMAELEEQLKKEQEEPKPVVRKQCKTERPDGAIDCYAEWYCPHCSSLLKRGYDAPWIKHCYKCGKPVAWGGDEVNA